MRATRRRGVGSPGTARSKSTVSDDIPFDSGTISSDTVDPGTRSASQRSSWARSSS
jgi:hypothetical protein